MELLGRLTDEDANHGLADLTLVKMLPFPGRQFDTPFREIQQTTILNVRPGAVRRGDLLYEKRLTRRALQDATEASQPCQCRELTPTDQTHDFLPHESYRQQVFTALGGRFEGICNAG